MKERGDLRNQLKAVRLRLKMSQQELADAAGVARQTIGGMEADLYSPSAAVALRLAAALGCTVEELFWLESRRETVSASLASQVIPGEPVSVALARIGERWVAHPLQGERGFRSEMVPADGIGTMDAASESMQVEITDDADALARTAVLAGCAPALSLWARSAERWYPGLRVHWISMNSRQSLESLAQQQVHIAGLHLRDPHTGQFNVRFVREALPNTPAVLVNLGIWEEGVMVAAGNPKRLQSAADLALKDVRIVNREIGSGARLLLDSLIDEAGVTRGEIAGYSDEAAGHQEVARRVAEGQADAGVGVEAVARSYGLGFVPLCQARYDLATLEEFMEQDPVRQLLSTLQHRWVRRQLSLLGGFDTSQTGEIVKVR